MRQKVEEEKIKTKAFTQNAQGVVNYNNKWKGSRYGS